MAIEEIYILHHTHVDIGYTDLQPAVAAKHVAHLSAALDCCRRTDDYPDDARFRWINEFSWPVLQFLRECPDRAEELFQRHREERMELCGLFVDPTDLYDQRSLREALRPSLQLAAEHGFPLPVAMTSDIPGQGWDLADLLPEHGIHYLSVAPNAMVAKPVEVPRPFHWVGPRGSSVLVWQSDWRIGWYGEGHVLGLAHGFDAARAGVTQYLTTLAGEDYPWRVLALHIASDNRPPIPELSDLVATWNERSDLPRMRLATNREFFDRLIALHGSDFPAFRAAWPDWWTEGLGSAAYETALSRETHSRLQRIEALQSRLGDDRDLWPIFEDLMLFDEHTWGCQNMAQEPHSFRSRASWTLKSSHIYRAHDAARLLEAELAGRLATATPVEDADFRDGTVRDAGPTAAQVSIYNPLSTDYHGPVVIPDLAPDLDALAATDGSSCPVQRSLATPLSPSRAWAALALKAQQQAVLRPVAGDSARLEPGLAEVIASSFYRLRHDGHGRIASLLDLQTEQELLDLSAPFAFAEVLHEHIAGTDDRNAVWQRGQTEIPYGKRRTDAPLVREGATAAAALVHSEDGPLFASLTWRSELPHVRNIETEICLWKPFKRIDVEVRLDKQPCETYDSLYVAFPFALDKPRAFVHSCGATFEAEAEQLPGTCRDYYAIEHFVALQGDARWALVTPLDAPLVQLGALTFGRWADHLDLRHGHLYSWLLNNFWYTNFPGYQHGRLTFRYAITTGAGQLDLGAAERFGEAARVGLAIA